MEGEYGLVVDMSITPGKTRPFDAEKLAEIIACAIPLIVDTYCDGTVGGVVSVRSEDQLYGAVEEVQDASPV
jgi:hypothetical protein